MAILLSGCYVYENAGWIVGIGPNSLNYRQQFVTWITDHPEDVEMNFGSHPVMSKERKELFRQYPGSSSNPSLIEPVAATRLTGEAAPQLCRGGSIPEFTRRPGTGGDAWEPGISGWKYRSLDSIFGKSARMNMAIVRGQIMKSELRRSIAMLKSGGADVTPELDGWGFCDQYIPEAPSAPCVVVHFGDCALTPTPHEAPEPEKWPETLEGSTIHLDHAPTLIVRHIEGMTSGMCLAGHCQDADMVWKVSLYRDLFETVPSLTNGQQEAIDALDRMGTLDFWLQAAHENGVTDKDDRVKLHFEEARQIQKAIIDQLSYRDAREVYDNRRADNPHKNLVIWNHATDVPNGIEDSN